MALLVFFSNTGVALSMHFCKGENEKITMNHLDNKHCEKEVKVKSCCDDDSDSDDEECCSDIALQNKFIDKQIVDILKIQFNNIIDFPTKFEYLNFNNVGKNQRLEFTSHFVESNAPPIYLQNSQLIFYA